MRALASVVVAVAVAGAACGQSREEQQTEQLQKTAEQLEKSAENMAKGAEGVAKGVPIWPAASARHSGPTPT
jgi:hypothetical protein